MSMRELERFHRRPGHAELAQLLRPGVRCQALSRLRRGFDGSNYPILGCSYADRQVPGT
jgi:hypothetical protein